MKHCNDIITIAKLDCRPILIYTKKGNVLETYGIDNNCMFSTIYYLPVKETTHCYIFRLLVPVKFCEQLFFKQTESTITVNKDCILGTHFLCDGTITNDVIIHQSFDDCIKGDYKIAKGFQETVIWQSNTENYEGEAKLEYKHGKEKWLEVYVEDKAGHIKRYKLIKNGSLTVKLKEVQSLKVAKQYVESKALGHYSIEVHGEITKKVKL